MHCKAASTAAGALSKEQHPTMSFTHSLLLTHPRCYYCMHRFQNLHVLHLWVFKQPLLFTHSRSGYCMHRAQKLNVLHLWVQSQLGMAPMTAACLPNGSRRSGMTHFPGCCHCKTQSQNTVWQKSGSMQGVEPLTVDSESGRYKHLSLSFRAYDSVSNRVRLICWACLDSRQMTKLFMTDNSHVTSQQYSV